jgi:hypothetical protein
MGRVSATLYLLDLCSGGGKGFKLTREDVTNVAVELVPSVSSMDNDDV